MRTIQIAMNGVTGRMGTNQHLVRSILSLRNKGGVVLSNGDRVMPEPILVGRNADKLAALAKEHNVQRWTTDVAKCLADPNVEIYFDAQATPLRVAAVTAAIEAGKHVYCEKPLAEDSAGARKLAELARKSGRKCGIVQDKLFLPGFRKLKQTIDSGFLGRLCSVRCEFGYWVFEGDLQPAQRPSWNYRKEDGGGIVLDMFAHWQYVIEGILGRIKSVSCIAATHIPRRVAENGQWYDCTADDAAYATFELENGVIAQINSSWLVRVHRDELVALQVDGTHGSAIAGLRGCKIQHRANTPRAVWNPDIPSTIDYYSHWNEVPDAMVYPNGFEAQWELYLRHVCEDAPFPHDFEQGARGVTVAEAALQSWRERRWVEVAG
jgi:predicted dehydrogenase